ncbi:hypothetical protein DFA_04197 [Cavenderia fasciculata]|uniref:Transmembrane protein n=1 Tax=Cavenderia fasciculata TaxID=261658 RepID=F4Q1K0_CACFS|nr:uncharacterized protein DFA_04197 [Cavenderia fasciculata]EGG18701.1 hypothetical protein DFA_04197 [Cavenderia fasciculata]|eukprot:XP_004366605.1 hypothetical protein DFA_04197 [Cavenderia fasciculata]
MKFIATVLIVLCLVVASALSADTVTYIKLTGCGGSRPSECTQKYTVDECTPDNLCGTMADPTQWIIVSALSGKTYNISMYSDMYCATTLSTITSTCDECNTQTNLTTDCPSTGSALVVGSFTVFMGLLLSLLL